MSRSPIFFYATLPSRLCPRATYTQVSLALGLPWPQPPTYEIGEPCRPYSATAFLTLLSYPSPLSYPCRLKCRTGISVLYRHSWIDASTLCWAFGCVFQPHTGQKSIQYWPRPSWSSSDGGRSCLWHFFLILSRILHCDAACFSLTAIPTCFSFGSLKWSICQPLQTLRLCWSVIVAVQLCSILHEPVKQLVNFRQESQFFIEYSALFRLSLQTEICACQSNSSCKLVNKLSVDEGNRSRGRVNSWLLEH